MSNKLSEIQARAFILQSGGLSAKQAMRRAAKEIARRERAAGKAAGAAPPASASSHHLSRSHLELMATCERWIHHLWSRTPKMARYVRLKQKHTEPSPPTLTDNPVVVVEPAAPLTNDPRLRQHFPAPLVVTGFANAKVIPNSEFPQRYTDPATENWKASITQNEQIAKERAARSLQLQNRNRGRYLG
jgi:hypothetical protein